MTRNIHHLIKTLWREGDLITHKSTDPGLGPSQYYCSTYIQAKKLLVKGEVFNPNKNQRNALLVFIDSETHTVKGKRGVRNKLTERQGRHFEFRTCFFGRELLLR